MNEIIEFLTPITTARLVLRPLRATDGDQLFKLFAHWDVVRFLSSPPWPYTRDDAEGFIQACLNNEGESAERFLVIERDGEFIGGISARMRLKSHLQRGPGPNIGYWLGKPYWQH